MAAKSVEQIEIYTETDSQHQVESQIKEDKSEPEMFQIGMVDPSVLKGTEGMEICTLDHKQLLRASYLTKRCRKSRPLLRRPACPSRQSRH